MITQEDEVLWLYLIAGLLLREVGDVRREYTQEMVEEFRRDYSVFTVHTENCAGVHSCELVIRPKEGEADDAIFLPASPGKIEGFN